MLGLALGDALGAPFEGGFLERLTWKVVARGRLRWTDDTQMALGCARSLVRCGGVDRDDLARTWAHEMESARGYGPGARRLLRRIARGEDWRVANRAIFPDGSFGNGAAMRAAPLGLFFHRDEPRLLAAAADASAITHAHPLGIEGGRLIALATALALAPEFAPDAFLARLAASCEHEEYRTRLALAGEAMTAGEIRARLGNSILAHESAVTAVHVFVRRHDRPFAEMIELAVQVGGDTDTIAAMAGGLYGARRGVGALPEELLARLEARSATAAAAQELWRAAPPPP